MQKLRTFPRATLKQTVLGKTRDVPLYAGQTSNSESCNQLWVLYSKMSSDKFQSVKSEGNKMRLYNKHKNGY